MKLEKVMQVIQIRTVKSVVQQRTVVFTSCLVEGSYKCLLYLCLCLYTKWAREESFFVDKLTSHLMRNNRPWILKEAVDICRTFMYFYLYIYILKFLYIYMN